MKSDIIFEEESVIVEGKLLAGQLGQFDIIGEPQGFGRLAARNIVSIKSDSIVFAKQQQHEKLVEWMDVAISKLQPDKFDIIGESRYFKRFYYRNIASIKSDTIIFTKQRKVSGEWKDIAIIDLMAKIKELEDRLKAHGI